MRSRIRLRRRDVGQARRQLEGPMPVASEMAPAQNNLAQRPPSRAQMVEEVDNQALRFQSQPGRRRSAGTLTRPPPTKTITQRPPRRHRHPVPQRRKASAIARKVGGGGHEMAHNRPLVAGHCGDLACRLVPSAPRLDRVGYGHASSSTRGGGTDLAAPWADSQGGADTTRSSPRAKSKRNELESWPIVPLGPSQSRVSAV